MGETRERKICSTLRDRIFEFPGAKHREAISCPEDCNLRAMIQIFIGEEESLHFMLNGQRVNNPSSLPLSGSLYLSMCAFTPSRSLLSSLFLVLSSRRGGKTRRGNGKGRRKGWGTGREGWRRGCKRRSGNRFMHRGAQALA